MFLTKHFTDCSDNALELGLVHKLLKSKLNEIWYFALMVMEQNISRLESLNLVLPK